MLIKYVFSRKKEYIFLYLFKHNAASRICRMRFIVCSKFKRSSIRGVTTKVNYKQYESESEMSSSTVRIADNKRRPIHGLNYTVAKVDQSRRTSDGRTSDTISSVTSPPASTN